MKLYSHPIAPNPKKVRVYLAEKGIPVDIVNVDLTRGEQRSAEYLARNARAAIPVLELDDGRCFAESLAIMEYFEELHPEPCMIGASAEERLRVRGIERLCEIDVFLPVLGHVRNTHPLLAALGPQNKEVASASLARARNGLGHVDRVIGESEFVAGDRPSIADCTLFAGLAFARALRLEVDLGPYANVARWWQAFCQRPSAAA